MQPCRRVGLNVTKRCNWRCQTCFYRWSPDFNKAEDRTVDDVMAEVRAAKARGCDHALAVGWGEPAIWPDVIRWIRACSDIGVSTSVITNGTGSISKYEEMFAAGLDHLHVSVHGLGDTANKIAGVSNAGDRQRLLLEWLAKNKHPWRMNMTVQRENHKELLDIARECVDHGCRHIISLGFLPLYEWTQAEMLRKVAVDPRELRPYIEQLAEYMVEVEAKSEVMFTIRYHPFCHLAQKYWHYIVNAKHVFYDPWEWEYGNLGKSPEEFELAACSMRDVVALQDPCRKCAVWEGCGGWNRNYAAGFDCIKAPLTTETLFSGNPKHVPAVAKMLADPAMFFDQNRTNHQKGWFGK